MEEKEVIIENPYGFVYITTKYKNNRFVPVVQIDKDGKCIETYFNSREAERQTGILHQNIGRCCNSKHTTAGGYFWRKLEDYDPNEVFPTKNNN